MKYLSGSTLRSAFEQTALHLLLMPLFFVLYSWKSYHYFFDWGGGILMGLAGVTALVVLTIVLYFLVFREKIKSGIAATVAGVIFFHYAALYYWLGQSSIPVLGRHRVLIPLLGLGWLLLLILLRKPKDFRKLNAYLNVLFAVLIAFEALQGVVALRTHKSWWDRLQAQYTDDRPLPALQTVAAPPDIYHIILDAHTSFASLERHWGYVDTTFAPWLQEKGFFLAKKSRSHYDLTVRSISSLFEMGELNLSDMPADRESLALQCATRKMIRQGIVPQLFRSIGYELINLSIFDLPGVDMYCKSEWVSDPEKTFSDLSGRTLAGQLWRDIIHPRSYLTNQAIMDTLIKTPEIPNKAPRFVYAHLTMPHAPYNFDSEGRLYRLGTQPGRSEQEAYLEYLIYCDRLMKSVLEELLQKIQRPSVIIVQGDHGFRKLEDRSVREEEAFSILNAIWFSDGDYTLLNDSISNIDTYPILLNKYFNAASN